METSRSSIPAFDAVAPTYDSAFSETAVGRLLRARVRDLATRETAGSRPATALELNCGTGEDALWLARQGWQVLATDISPKMVAATNARAISAGLGERIRAEVCATEEIARLHPAPGPSPDGRGVVAPFGAARAETPLPSGEGSGVGWVFSNFGGLNCLSPGALQKLATDLQLFMPSGGIFTGVVMSRFCWWETLYFLLKGKPREAFRRLGKGPVDAPLDEKTTVPAWYYSPAEFRRFMALKKFRIVNVQPAGFWLPPSYLNPFFEKHPRLLQFLNFLEKKCTASWMSPMADHFFVCFKT